MHKWEGVGFIEVAQTKAYIYVQDNKEMHLFIYLSLTTVAIIKIYAALPIVIQILLDFEFTTVFRITLQYIDLQYYYY